MNKLASIIIPAYNEERLIRKTLVSLKKQSYSPLEIVVVYRGKDKTAEIARQYTKKVFLLNQKGASQARNFGAKMAQGQFLLFLDADSELSENAVEKAIEHLKQRGVAGGTAKIIYESESYKIKGVEKLQNLCLKRWGICLCQFIYTTKEIFEKSGGWPESIEFGEDMNFLKRLSAFGKLKNDTSSQVLTSPRRFIRNKDYFYAVFGGFLVLSGIKNLPFYAIREKEEKRTKIIELKGFLNKEIPFPFKTQRFFLNIINRERFRKILKTIKKL